MDTVIPSEAIESSTEPGEGPGGGRRIASRNLEPPTERLPVAELAEPGGEALAEGPDTQVTAPLVSTARNQCAVCGSALAPDQRYCVECGERRGTARVPQLEGIAERARTASATGSPRRRTGVSVNNTLLAIIGTLLLALGVGVLIGRTSSSSSKTLAPQVVTVAGSGVTGGAGSSASQQASGAAAAAAAAKARAGAARAGAKAPPKHTKVPLKVVKVGSPGKGPGYQHGHFTGNFFGPGSEK